MNVQNFNFSFSFVRLRAKSRDFGFQFDNHSMTALTYRHTSLTVDATAWMYLSASYIVQLFLQGCFQLTGPHLCNHFFEVLKLIFVSGVNDW